MKKPPIKTQLLEFLQENHGVFSSGELQKLEWRNERGKIILPRTIVRRLQESAQEGKIHVEIRGGTAHYSADPIEKPKRPKYREMFVDGHWIAVQIQ